MDKYLKYYILKEKGVIIEVLKGSITLQDYIAFKMDQLNDKDFTPELDYFIDYCDVNIVFSNEMREKIEQYIAFSKTIENPSRYSKVAVITNTPDQVVFSTILGSSDERKINYKIFSTMEAALSWVGLTDSDIDIVKTK